MAKRRIAVVMGGYSREFEISLQSGSVVCDSLDTDKYEIFPVHILKEGWFYPAPDGSKYPINKSDFSFSNGTEDIVPDLVFNIIHGTPGEDGYLQAYLSLIGIPQTSSDFYQAALCFNKRDCLTVLKGFGVKCANSFFVNKGFNYNIEEIVRSVGLPCFIKPNRGGSSFGITKAYSIDEIEPAIEKAFKEDSEIIIETALQGVEVSVGVYRNKKEVVVLPATEIVSENDYFDYDAKYLGQSDEITPARISKEDTERVQAEARKIYQILNMSGVTRTDFIIEDGIPYVIETNTNPGLSVESIVPKQVRATGLSLSDFFDILIENALEQEIN
jgi:D-alanine-D-alanine ligase